MNGDLISREDVLRVFYNKEPVVQGEHDGMGMLAHALWRHIREAVEAIPIVEAEPVVHARWEFLNDYQSRCSRCHSEVFVDHDDEPPYCERCGAHMDEEVAE